MFARSQSQQNLMVQLTACKRVWQETRRLGRVGWRSLSTTFLDTRCAVCDRPVSQVFCLDCSRQIASEYSLAKGQFAASERLDERSEIAQKLSVGALGVYQGTLKQAILSLKYKDRAQVAQVLGVALAKQWQRQIDHWPRPLYGVPIPLHPNRLAQRGYNQAALIARSFSQCSGIGLAEHALLRCEDTKPQHQLGPEARRENLASVFDVSAAWRKQLLKSQAKPSVVLIDDIYTTGATAQSAAKTLRAAGIRVVAILVLARAVTD